MADNPKTLTTSEFAKLSGIPVGTVTQMLRQGKIRGQKRGGKWAIPADEIKIGTPAASTAPGNPSAASSSAPSPSAATGKGFDIETFARMTYLTENGVRQWLKIGRLSGSPGADGQLKVDAANLERPELKHLIRH